MKHKALGFTLIELLVAMSLLTTIMLLGSWSFSIFTSKWEGRLGNFSTNVSEAKDHILLNEIVAAIIPYVYNQGNKPSYYFEGEKNSFKATTLGSIFNTKSAVAFNIQIKQHSDSSFYLVYQEGVINQQSDPSTVKYSDEKILIAKGEDIHFEYLGWVNLHQKMMAEDSLESNQKLQWLTKYNSGKTSLMPIAIRIYWDDSIFEIPLNNEQGKWLTFITTSGINSE